MKIAVLYCGRIDDGVGNHVFNTSKYLEKLGYQIHIFWRELVNTQNIKSFMLKTSLLPHINRYQFEFYTIGKLKRLEEYDIVSFQGSGLIFGLYKKITKLKVPLVVTSHGAIPYSEYLRVFPSPPTLRRKFVRYFLWPTSTLVLKYSMKLADTVFSVSSNNANEIERMGIPEDKITVIYNGVDISKFKKIKEQHLVEFKKKLGIENDLVVLFFGRLHSQKGLLYLIKAIPHILKEIKAKFVFVGKGPQEIIAKQIANKLGISDHLLFEGFIPESLKPYYFSICDVFAFPSIYEGFPIVPMEAAAFGKPIVAFDIPPVVEFIKDGKNGLLTQTGDYKALATNISYLLKNSKQAQRLGKNNKNLVETEFTWEAVARRMDNAFRRLI
ncbi:MAG: glycosyltransferase family 4 protein [Promethearchaeota archaeon]